MILLVNAQVSEIKLPAFIPLFSGKYPDFTVDWYRVVGTTISFTMLINIVSPHAGALIGMFTTSIFRSLDQSCCCNPKRTKQRLQEDYEALYTGPEFLIEIRYS